MYGDIETASGANQFSFTNNGSMTFNSLGAMLKSDLTILTNNGEMRKVAQDATGSTSIGIITFDLANQSSRGYLTHNAYARIYGIIRNGSSGSTQGILTIKNKGFVVNDGKFADLSNNNSSSTTGTQIIVKEWHVTRDFAFTGKNITFLPGSITIDPVVGLINALETGCSNLATSDTGLECLIKPGDNGTGTQNSNVDDKNTLANLIANGNLKDSVFGDIIDSSWNLTERGLRSLSNDFADASKTLHQTLNTNFNVRAFFIDSVLANAAMSGGGMLIHSNTGIKKVQSPVESSTNNKNNKTNTKNPANNKKGAKGVRFESEGGFGSV
ncbi:hypothetical protein [Helicobacter fennelliae]|uniref:hypothetical protein n=1 Tax=Helicobacter fennelliae TaxID=215 RepID=UPI000E05039A|nr:hypothetical protein [Helicobacter fennelliae]STQ83916.1 Uncharacterised protein [Helicobacter fennelliae]